MDPLITPKQWPPPEMPPPCKDEQWWSRWPIIGFFPWWFYRSRRYTNFTCDVLEPIQEEIVSQLVLRKGNVDWPSKDHAAVAKIISEAIGSEKRIEQPPIMPEDSFSLLFWGAYDDCTGLIFALEFSRKFKVQISSPEFMQFYEEDQTVGDFIDYCVERIKQRGRK